MEGTIVAIDPGANGGIAWQVQGFPVRAAKMPADIVSEIKRINDEHKITMLVIEKQQVWSSGKGDDDRGRMMQMQKLIASYNKTVGGLQALGIPVVEIASISWQSYLKLRSKGENIEKRDRKKNYQVYAQKQCPHLRVTLNTADAICMLAYLDIRSKAEPEKFRVNKPTTNLFP